MKRYLLLLSFLALFISPAFSQKVVLEQDVTKDTIPKTFGPNQKYYGHFYGGYGFMAGPAEAKGSEINYLNSHEFIFGYRFKLKVAKFYALGLEAYVNPQVYKLKQQPGKTLTNTILYDDEKLKLTNIGASVYNRINYGKRGNHIGNFVDFGAFGNWTPFKTHVYEDDQIFHLAGPMNAVKKVKVRETGLNYVADFNYGVLGRIGFNRFVLYGSYRLSELFNTGYHSTGIDGNNLFDFAELPRATVGFQVGFH